MTASARRGPNQDMNNEISLPLQGLDSAEIQEWLESLDSVLQSSGPDVASYILERLRAHAKVMGIDIPFTANTPYVNTIPPYAAAGFSGRPGTRAPHQEPGPLERDGHGGARESRRRTASAGIFPPTLRPPRFTKSASTISSGHAPRHSKATRLFPGPRFAGNLCARVSGRPASAKSSWKISGANCAGRRACLPIRIPG